MEVRDDIRSPVRSPRTVVLSSVVSNEVSWAAFESSTVKLSDDAMECAGGVARIEARRQGLREQTLIN